MATTVYEREIRSAEQVLEEYVWIGFFKLHQHVVLKFFWCKLTKG